MIATLLVVSACGKGISQPVVPHVPVTQLESAPDSLDLAGVRLVLWTNLWRDFQPIAPPDGKPLIALIRLAETDSMSIPSEVSPNYIWVLNGDQVWASRLSSENRPPTPEYQVERVARDGPKWGPGINVDVVVGIQVRDEPMTFVAAREQPIFRTD